MEYINMVIGILVMTALFVGSWGEISFLAYIITFRDERTKMLVTRVLAISFLVCLFVVPYWENYVTGITLWQFTENGGDNALIALPCTVVGVSWLIIKRKNGVKFFEKYDSGAEGENEALAGGAGGALHGDQADN